MVDTVSSEKRSQIMARVRGKDTGPEMIVRRLLHRNGYRFRLHVKPLAGCPDIVLKKFRTVIFVHGCFWHGHGCTKGRPPKSNLSFWLPKIERNLRRDKKNTDLLKEDGWKVLTLWSCELKNESKLIQRIQRFFIG